MSEQVRLVQRLAHPRDVRVERGLRVVGRALAPERVDQAVARDDLARVEQQHGDQRLLLRPAESQRPVAPPNVEGPEHVKLQAVCQSATLPGCQPDVSAPSGQVGTVPRVPTPTEGRTPCSARSS